MRWTDLHGGGGQVEAEAAALEQAWTLRWSDSERHHAQVVHDLTTKVRLAVLRLHRRIGSLTDAAGGQGRQTLEAQQAADSLKAALAAVERTAEQGAYSQPGAGYTATCARLMECTHAWGPTQNARRPPQSRTLSTPSSRVCRQNARLAVRKRPYVASEQQSAQCNPTDTRD